MTSTGNGTEPAFSIPDIPRHHHMTIHEYVYFRLRNALMLGAVKPGTSLKIRALAAYMGISPTPIREALRRLSSENALEVLGNRRIIVPRITAGKFEELVLLRICLERLAARRALPYVSDILIRDMSVLDDRMDEAVARGQYDLLTVLNQSFHERLYTANHHQAVMPQIQSVWLQLGPFQRQLIRTVMDTYQIDRHKEILSALSARDPQALQTAIEADIRDGIGQAGKKVLADEGVVVPCTGKIS